MLEGLQPIGQWSPASAIPVWGKDAHEDVILKGILQPEIVQAPSLLNPLSSAEAPSHPHCALSKFPTHGICGRSCATEVRGGLFCGTMPVYHVTPRL